MCHPASSPQPLPAQASSSDAQPEHAGSDEAGEVGSATVTPCECLQGTAQAGHSLIDNEQAGHSLIDNEQAGHSLLTDNERRVASLRCLLQALRGDRELYRLHDELDGWLNDLPEGFEKIEARLPHAVPADRLHASRRKAGQTRAREGRGKRSRERGDAPAASPAALRRMRSPGRSQVTRSAHPVQTASGIRSSAPRRLQTIVVERNGECTIQCVLAAKQKARSFRQLDLSDAASLRQRIKAAPSGYLSNGQAEALLAIFDCGAVVVRAADTQAGLLHYFVRRPQAQLFVVVRESTCPGGVHWAPVKCGGTDGDARCELLTLERAQRFMELMGISERDTFVGDEVDGVIVV